MAVLDFLPERMNAGKIASDKPFINLKLIRGPKIIEQIKEIAPATLLVGFKLEANSTERELIKRAEDLMARTGAELVVANDQAKLRDGEHPALICKKTEGVTEFTKVGGKREIARVLCDEVDILLEKKQEGLPRNGRQIL